MGHNGAPIHTDVLTADYADYADSELDQFKSSKICAICGSIFLHRCPSVPHRWLTNSHRRPVVPHHVVQGLRDLAERADFDRVDQLGEDVTGVRYPRA